MNSSTETLVRARDQVKTIGTSPKVKLPALALAGLGALLVILSQVVEGTGALLEVGLGLVGASGVTAGLGGAAKPGTVLVHLPEHLQQAHVQAQAPTSKAEAPARG